MTIAPTDRLVDRLGFLEPLGEAVHQLVARLEAAAGPPGAAVKDLLNGTWLGHPLHPALTDIPLGAWSGASLLDLADRGAGGDLGRAADLLVGVGCAGGVAAALSGVADWQDKYGKERNLATLHAVLNVSALVLMSASLAQRLRGARGPAVGMSAAGTGAAIAGAYLGGDLVFRLGIQVNRNAFSEGPSQWCPAASAGELEEGAVVRREVGGRQVMLTRLDGEICAASAICSHSGGPLDELGVEDGQVRCPWHGSRFALRTGRVTRGPATVANPVFQTRVRQDRVEIRLPPR
ncbi:MAG TPA: Rieske 2Fe-2S domain-containing protein [Candidatus Micrarchaeia archaeon]|nr:Rieske 2Fe-2S domain-containing protein [Candidatus Micrarchaeia archaeon]